MGNLITPQYSCKLHKYSKGNNRTNPLSNQKKKTYTFN